MLIGIPREIHQGEKRVATTPTAAEKIPSPGYAIAMESDAGESASFTDDAYREADITVLPQPRKYGLWQ